MYRTTIEILTSGIYTTKALPHEGALLDIYDSVTEGEK